MQPIGKKLVTAMNWQQEPIGKKLALELFIKNIYATPLVYLCLQLFLYSSYLQQLPLKSLALIIQSCFN